MRFMRCRGIIIENKGGKNVDVDFGFLYTE